MQIVKHTARLALAASLLLTACAGPKAHEEAEPQAVWTGALDESAFAALHELTTATPPAPIGTTVVLADGSSAYLSEAPGGAAPGILVIHEWWGLNDHIRHWADRLAANGYNALAVDLYQGAVATTPDEAMAAMRAVDPERATATLRAAAAYMNGTLKVPKYGTIGWCFGGKWSRLAAQDLGDVGACVVFYGQLSTDGAELAQLRAPLLGIFGTRDASIPLDVVAAFEAAAVEAGVPVVEIRRYDAQHAFANPSSARYDPVAAAAAWNEVQAFLAEHLR